LSPLVVNLSPFVVNLSLLIVQVIEIYCKFRLNTKNTREHKNTAASVENSTTKQGGKTAKNVLCGANVVGKHNRHPIL